MRKQKLVSTGKNFFLQNILKKAYTKVRVGGLYYHYKDPQIIYRLDKLGLDETTHQVMVVYTSFMNGDGEITWIRPLNSWLELVDGGKPRFSLVE